MDPSEENLKAYSIKKTKRLESKKRKMEALIDLLDTDSGKTNRLESKKRKVEVLIDLTETDSATLKKVKKSESLAVSCNELKQELKRLIKKPDVTPYFFLKDRGFKASTNFVFSPSNLDPTRTVTPLLSNDVIDLVLRSVLADTYPNPPTWCKLEHPQGIEQTVLLVVDGITKADVVRHKKELQNIPNIFIDIFDVLTPNRPFASKLCEVPSFEKQDYLFVSPPPLTASFIPVKESQELVLSKAPFSPCNRLHLLLSPIQLLKEHYPLPISVYPKSKSEGFVFTKEKYAPVTENSPIFSVDCEMCITTAKENELTRVAIVDENLQPVYETLVKPRNTITNYLTRYSGITKEMLENVTVRLEDVQKKIQEILPPDAILCGQSLNCDLTALKMMHPYIIETSIIFNTHGTRHSKTSLKNFLLLYLNEVIQNHGSAGHCPIEDAGGAMKLVNLKLEKGLTFGDAVLDKSYRARCPSKRQWESYQVKSGKFQKSVIEEIRDHFSTDSRVFGQSFFDTISLSNKTVGIVGSKTALSSYKSKIFSEKVEMYSTTKVVKATLKIKSDFDLIISHLTLNTAAETMSCFNKTLKHMYDSLSPKTMFIVHISGKCESKRSKNDLKQALLFAALKS